MQRVAPLDRIARLLRPGGLLRLHDLVYDFDPAEAADRIPAWLAGAVDDPAVGWTATELAEHVRGEFSTYRWLLEALLDRTGVRRGRRPLPAGRLWRLHLPPPPRPTGPGRRRDQWLYLTTSHRADMLT